jgi:hypothetical protein
MGSKRWNGDKSNQISELFVGVKMFTLIDLLAPFNLRQLSAVRSCSSAPQLAKAE